MTATFDPPVAPDIGSGIAPNVMHDGIQYHAGYDEVRTASRWSPAVANLSWTNVEETTFEYLYSFFAYQLKGGAEAFYWTPFDKVISPSGCVPTLTQSAGGTNPADVYFAVYTLYHAVYGETLPSSEATLSVGANAYLTATVPPVPNMPTGTHGFRVYVGDTTGGPYYIQTGGTVTDGTESWTQSDAYSTSGSQPPSSNTLSGPRLWRLVGSPRVTRPRPNHWNVSAQLVEQYF